MDITSNNGLTILDKGHAYIQSGNFRIVHTIDLNILDFIVMEIEKIYESLKDEKSSFKNLLDSKLFVLKENLKNLKPHRVKRWDALGSGIKWLAGNPDADDLRSIDKNLDNLIRENNNQVKVNLENTLQIKKIQENVSLLAGNIDILKNTFEQINLLLNIDMAIEKIKAINEAIILSKNKIASKNLISQEEMKILQDKIQPLTLPSTTQVINLASATVTYDGNNILYIIDIPTIDPTSYKKLHVETIPKDDKEIKLDFTEILVHNDIVLAVGNECTAIQNYTLCMLNDLKNISGDECILNAKKDPHCIYKQQKNEVNIKMIEKGVIIAKNANKIKIFNTCGIGNHTISGSAFIMFEKCSVIIDGQIQLNDPL